MVSVFVSVAVYGFANLDEKEPTDYVKFKSEENLVVETSNPDDTDDTANNTDEAEYTSDTSATEERVDGSTTTEDQSNETETTATDNDPAGPYASNIIAKMFQNLNYEIDKYETEFRKLKN